MTIQKGICAECSKEYEYEYNPQFPRKYCHECSAAKKASYSAGDVPKQQTSTAQPVNAPIVKPGSIPSIPNKSTTMYVSYAKDTFKVLVENAPNKEKINPEGLMIMAIELVKQAKEAFE